MMYNDSEEKIKSCLTEETKTGNLDEIDILETELDKTSLQDKLADIQSNMIEKLRITKTTIKLEEQTTSQDEPLNFTMPNKTLFSTKAKTKFTIMPTISSEVLLQFLHHVGYGEQAEAETMLQKDKRLALACGDLTDCSMEPKTYKPRTWQNITALQYALLALDYHMWTMLLKYMNKQDVCAQIEALKGIARLNSEQGWEITSSTVNWPSLMWHSLIKELDEYIQNYDAWDGSQCAKHWCQQVGNAQLILPAHIINEYSHPGRPKGFSKCCTPGFWNGKDKDVNLPRAGVKNWINNNNYKLGINFAWLRGGGGQVIRHQSLGVDLQSRVARWGSMHEIDLAAVTELLRSRTKQAQALVLQITPDMSPHLAVHGFAADTSGLSSGRTMGISMLHRFDNPLYKQAAVEDGKNSTSEERSTFQEEEGYSSSSSETPPSKKRSTTTPNHRSPSPY